MALHPVISTITDRIIERSRPTRQVYLNLIKREGKKGPRRSQMSCGNLAHGFAAAGSDKSAIRDAQTTNIGIITAFNDMLSAHQPYRGYPDQIKIFAREVGATAQVAGGVPAMCDGITQGRRGMELSLWSREVIALATSVALSHEMFEGMLLLGICDKIVPGLLIGALRFGHLPAIFVPAGPMPSGLPNKEKQRIRQLYAENKIGRNELLNAEASSYHDAGTCTFYGTANSNQMMMEVMGLHIPGAAFVNPGTKLRQELTRTATHQLVAIARNNVNPRPVGLCVDEKAIVNAAVGLLATGGSSNHTIHLPAIARAAGIIINWDDLSQLSSIVPTVARIYPNGTADVNQFHKAGGMAFVITTLLKAGLLHPDILTVGDDGLQGYGRMPVFERDRVIWHAAPVESGDKEILRPASNPFMKNGGLKLVSGNLGRAIFKTSAVDPEHWTVEAPARVFSDQDQVLAEFRAGKLDRDVVVILRFQGPKANGMPELHKLTPALSVLQNRGYHVALVTDGRMSGASGKIPSAIHLCPEALSGGPLAKVKDGDLIQICAKKGCLNVLINEDEWASRPHVAPPDLLHGTGNELFALMRHNVDSAEQGASAILQMAGL